jgi:hypothetical protein
MAAFSSQVRDHPVAFPKLKILEPKGRHFGPPEAAADEKREQSAISSAAKGVGCFSAE